MSPERETSQQDRIFDLVTELLEAGERPREIQDSVRDAIAQWKMTTLAAKQARP